MEISSPQRITYAVNSEENPNFTLLSPENNPQPTSQNDTLEDSIPSTTLNKYDQPTQELAMALSHNLTLVANQSIATQKVETLKEQEENSHLTAKSKLNDPRKDFQQSTVTSKNTILSPKYEESQLTTQKLINEEDFSTEQNPNQTQHYSNNLRQSNSGKKTLLHDQIIYSNNQEEINQLLKTMKNRSNKSYTIQQSKLTEQDEDQLTKELFLKVKNTSDKARKKHEEDLLQIDHQINDHNACRSSIANAPHHKEIVQQMQQTPEANLQHKGGSSIKPTNYQTRQKTNALVQVPNEDTDTKQRSIPSLTQTTINGTNVHVVESELTLRHIAKINQQKISSIEEKSTTSSTNHPQNNDQVPKIINSEPDNLVNRDQKCENKSNNSANNSSPILAIKGQSLQQVEKYLKTIAKNETTDMSDSIKQHQANNSAKTTKASEEACLPPHTDETTTIQKPRPKPPQRNTRSHGINSEQMSPAKEISAPADTKINREYVVSQMLQGSEVLQLEGSTNRIARLAQLSVIQKHVF